MLHINPVHIIKSLFIILLVLLFSASQGNAQDINKAAQASSFNVDSLEKELKEPLNDSLRIEVLIKLSAILSPQKPFISLSYANEALEIAERIKNDYHRARVTNIIGTVYQMMSDHQKAMYYYLKALRLLDEGKNIHLQITLLTNIGSCYGTLRQYEHAKTYLKKGIVLCNKYHITRSLGFLYNNLGMIAFEQNKTLEAISYFKHSIQEKANSSDNASIDGIIYGNLGDCYIRVNQLSLAEYYYKKALQTINPDDTYTLIAYYNSLGKLHMQKKNYKEASVFFFKAKELSEKSSVHLSSDRVYENIALMYEQQEDFRNAYKYKNLYHAIKDSTTNEKIAQQINEMQAKYEFDKKDKEILLLNQEKLIAENKADKERLLRGFAIIALVFILIISLVVARVFILKQRVKNKLLAEEKAIIEKDMIKLLHENSEARYEVLKSKTNPHFLFNSLTTLSSIVIEDPKSALEFIDRFSSLYRMILETGETKLITLNEELKVVNAYLYLQKMKFGENLLIEMHIPDELLSHLLPPFALQMIVENAAKHNIISASHPLKITITSRDETIMISNNLRKKNSRFASTSIGQKNITERYSALSAKLPAFIETTTDYIVTLPLLPAKSQEAVKEENFISL